MGGVLGCHQGWRERVPALGQPRSCARALPSRGRGVTGTRGVISERPERGPEQRHAVQVVVVRHAELRRGGGRGGRRRRAPAPAHGHPAAQPAAAGLAGRQGEHPRRPARDGACPGYCPPASLLEMGGSRAGKGHPGDMQHFQADSAGFHPKSGPQNPFYTEQHRLTYFLIPACLSKTFDASTAATFK